MTLKEFSEQVARAASFNPEAEVVVFDRNQYACIEAKIAPVIFRGERDDFWNKMFYVHKCGSVKLFVIH
jgi:hypothetical protein